MGKIKKFIKDHKTVLVGTVVGIGGAAACVVAHELGFKKGFQNTAVSLMAMLNADIDGTCMFVESCIGDLSNNEDFIALGNTMLQNVSK